MPSNYPEGFDVFNEPSLPEETFLSSAGTGSRNHPEHHRDLGDAVEKIEHYASQRTHDHSGSVDDITGITKGPKLLQANTHETPDTDDAATSLHHTLGGGEFQSAPGNHAHAYASLTGRPLIPCTSVTRPGTPTPGLLIYELDTFRLRSWAKYATDPDYYWKFLLGPLPTVSLLQSAAQQIDWSGSIVEWHEELEDSAMMFDGDVSLTDITIKETGTYQIDVGVQWDPNLVPDIANIVVTVNGDDTELRQSQFMRGNLLTPGFSQTISTSGKLRLVVGDIVRVKAYYTNSDNIFDQIFSYWDSADRINSRIDIAFLG